TQHSLSECSGGQITSDAGLLPLRAFDQRHHLTRDWAALLRDPRQDDRVRHDSLALLRQRLYQIVAGYEDANDADRLRHDPLLQIVADQKLGEALGSQPTLSRWENAPSARDLIRLNDTWCDQFIRLWATRSASAARFCSMSIPPTTHLWPAATRLLPRGLRSTHVSPHAGIRTPYRLPAGSGPASGHRLQSSPHRPHAVAPSTASAICLPPPQDQAAR